MATYRLKAKPVIIVPYVEGMEDAWLVIYNGNSYHYEQTFSKLHGKKRALEFISGNKGVYEINYDDENYPIIYEEPIPFIRVNGSRQYILRDEFILTDLNGNRRVISEGKINEDYDLISTI